MTEETLRVSIVIPTLNSAATLRQCLESVAQQDFPKENLELVFVDGGSVDVTATIIAEFQQSLHPAAVKIAGNLLKTGEAGKAVGAKAANGDIICFLDSDNVLPQHAWLKQMVLPFNDPQIIGAEPIEYTYRREDGFINRYAALMGMSDPLCFFVGNYDKYNQISRKWTSIALETEDKGAYLKVSIKAGQPLPTIGANGFLIRSKELNRCDIGEFLFDVDVLHALLGQNHGQVTIAKVKTGIIHLFSTGISTFMRKQKRRMRDYLYYRRSNDRRYGSAANYGKWGIAKFALYCLLVFPLFIQAVIGFSRKRDAAWFFHPLACWITLVTYSWGFIIGKLSGKTVSRDGWRQG